MAQYANGFSVLANKESGECIIAFVQNQPELNLETGKFDTPATEVVATVIFPFELGKELAKGIEDVIVREEEKEE